MSDTETVKTLAEQLLTEDPNKVYWNRLRLLTPNSQHGGIVTKDVSFILADSSRIDVRVTGGVATFLPLVRTTLANDRWPRLVASSTNRVEHGLLKAEEVLKRGEKNSYDLSEAAGLSRSTLLPWLGELVAAGKITKETKGRNTTYKWIDEETSTQKDSHEIN